MADQKPKSSLDEQIEENLRKVYRKPLEEEVPDRFLQLIAQLKEQDARNGK